MSKTNSNLNYFDYYQKLLVWEKWVKLKRNTTPFYNLKDNIKYKFFHNIIKENIKNIKNIIIERLDLRGDYSDNNFFNNYVSGLMGSENKKLIMNFDYNKELENLYTDFLELDFVKNEIDKLFTYKNYFLNILPNKIKDFILTFYNLGVYLFEFTFNRVKNYIIYKLNSITDYIKHNITPDKYLEKIEKEKDKLFKS